MKKILTVLVSLVLLLSLATQAFAYGAWDEVEDNVYKLNFEGNIQTNSGRFTSTDMAVFSGYQALVYKPYSGSLQGGRDIAFQYFDEDETRILPAGEYEVSMWIYDTADMLNSEPDGDAFLVMTFFTPDQTELLFDVYGNENGQYYNTEKCAYYYDLIDFYEGEVYATKGETVENDTGIWTKYTFDITTPVDCDKASFYILQPTPCTTHTDQLFIIDEVVLVAKGADTAATTEAPATETEAPATETEAPATETEAPATETEAPKATETEAPATQAPSEVVDQAAQTFDFGVVAAIAAVVSLAGYAVAKKH